MPVSIYCLTPGLMNIVLRYSKNGAVCYTCGKPLKLRDVVVSKFSRASHRSYRHAKCALLKDIVDKSDIERDVGQ